MECSLCKLMQNGSTYEELGGIKGVDAADPVMGKDIVITTIEHRTLLAETNMPHLLQYAISLARRLGLIHFRIVLDYPDDGCKTDHKHIHLLSW